MRFLLSAFLLSIAMAQPGDQAYAKWLNEDVVYIVTPEERAAFQKLKLSEEREHFIEQFWLRRDPTPDTVENEFKEEHYRRIAYANDRYNAAVPGWNTDRGRMYILYGPPDEIESHPQQARESWMFHKLEGIGVNVIVEFTDPAGTGDFRMTRDPAAAK